MFRTCFSGCGAVRTREDTLVAANLLRFLCGDSGPSFLSCTARKCRRERVAFNLTRTWFHVSAHRSRQCLEKRLLCDVLGRSERSWPQTSPMTLTESFLRALSLLLERNDLFGCVFLIIQKLMIRQKGVTKPFSLLCAL